MEREMWLIWKHPQSRRRFKIGLLRKDEKGYSFVYENPELCEAKEVGFDFFPGFDDLDKVYKSDKLFANIETRLPNVNRSDYLEILNMYNLGTYSSKFDILRATKGRLVTDNYEFVPVFDENKLEFDVAGTRYCVDVNKCRSILGVNDRLYLEMDSENQYDDYAIKVIFMKDNKKYHLGYVPRYYSKQLSKLLKNGVNYSALVQSLNFETDINDEDITACVKLIFDI